MAEPEPDKPAGEDFSKSLKELEKELNELKAKIEQERRATTCPSTPSLAIPIGRRKPKTDASIARRTRTRNRAAARKFFDNFFLETGIASRMAVR